MTELRKTKRVQRGNPGGCLKIKVNVIYNGIYKAMRCL